MFHDAGGDGAFPGPGGPHDEGPQQQRPRHHAGTLVRAAKAEDSDPGRLSGGSGRPAASPSQHRRGLDSTPQRQKQAAAQEMEAEPERLRNSSFGLSPAQPARQPAFLLVPAATSRTFLMPKRFVPSLFLALGPFPVAREGHRHASALLQISREELPSLLPHRTPCVCSGSSSATHVGTPTWRWALEQWGRLSNLRGWAWARGIFIGDAAHVVHSSLATI